VGFSRSMSLGILERLDRRRGPARFGLPLAVDVTAPRALAASLVAEGGLGALRVPSEQPVAPCRAADIEGVVPKAALWGEFKLLAGPGPLPLPVAVLPNPSEGEGRRSGELAMHLSVSVRGLGRLHLRPAVPDSDAT